MNTRENEPLRIFFDSCSDLLISEDIDSAEFRNALQLEDLDNGSRESTLRSLFSTFHKHEDGVGFNSLI